MAHLLTTERLTLREFTPGDAPFILELLNTESWIRYIGDRNVRTPADAANYLQNGPMYSYRQQGYGLWLVSLKDGNVPVGMCGLIKRETLDAPDIGFAFLPRFTGQGFALEAAKATLHFAFDDLKLSRLLAVTLPENQHSIRLLEKIGMVAEGTVCWPQTNETLLLYAISKAG